MNCAVILASNSRAPLALVIVCLMLPGCLSLRAYEGPHRAADELAHINGDMRVSAGLPVSIVLRQIDGLYLGLRHNGADVSPGAHSLLIDCTVTESKHTSRHHLDVDVYAGVKYRLVANTGMGNRECTEVQLVSVN